MVRGGRQVELGPRRQRALLALLALHANQVVAGERLIDELWGEAPPASAANMIQVYVSRLRKALGPGVLLTQPPGYVLQVGEGQLDSARFATLLAATHHLERTQDSKTHIEDRARRPRGQAGHSRFIPPQSRPLDKRL